MSGHGIYNYMFSLPFICYIPNLVIFGPVVLEKMFTDDGQRTTDDDGRQSIAIGHPSDLGDLKRRSLKVHVYFLR